MIMHIIFDILEKGGIYMVRTLLKPLSFLPALLLMYMIYNFSAQPAELSSQLSFQVSCKLVEAADYILDTNLEQWEIEDWATRIHFITRKLAHMTEYFLLAVAVSFPLYVYGVRGIWLMLLAGLICVGFACGDEYHQSFIDGRSPSKKDVAIDSFGVFVGIILVRIVGWTGRKTIFRPRKKKQKRKQEPQMQYAYMQQPYPQQTYTQQSYSQQPYRSNSQNPDFRQQVSYRDDKNYRDDKDYRDSRDFRDYSSYGNCRDNVPPSEETNAPYRPYTNAHRL